MLVVCIFFIEPAKTLNSHVLLFSDGTEPSACRVVASTTSEQPGGRRIRSTQRRRAEESANNSDSGDFFRALFTTNVSCSLVGWVTSTVGQSNRSVKFHRVLAISHLNLLCGVSRHVRTWSW